MIRIAPLGRALAVAAAASLALTACGGGEDSGRAGCLGAGGRRPLHPLPPPTQGDGALTIGTLLPQTGSLAFLGPPEFAGVELAVKDINAAGGVLGKPVDPDRHRLG